MKKATVRISPTIAQHLWELLEHHLVQGQIQSTKKTGDHLKISLPLRGEVKEIEFDISPHNLEHEVSIEEIVIDSPPDANRGGINTSI